ncbi:hypothetical protein Tco_1395797, partial [Tanacetum coccineum]
TNVNVPLEDDQSSLFAYVVWIFLAFLTYPVVPPYLLSTGNEDTIFDLGISIYHSFMPDVSHRSGTFMKFNVYPNRLNENDTLREKLLNVNLLIAKIDSLRDNPTVSSEVVIKSTSTFPNLFLEETNTFDNSYSRI